MAEQLLEMTRSLLAVASAADRNYIGSVLATLNAAVLDGTVRGLCDLTCDYSARRNAVLERRN